MPSSIKKILFCLCTGLLFTACAPKQAEEKEPEPTPANFGIDVEADGNVHIVTSQGNFNGGTEIPKDWPADVPTYPGATVEYAATIALPEGKQGLTLTVSTSDTIADAVKFYTDTLTTQGWKIQSSMQSGDNTIIAAQKDTRTLATSISTLDGKTTISMGVGKE